MASPAAAQIYSWRDADGKLVLSDKPRADQRRPDDLRSAWRGAVKATDAAPPSKKSAPFERRSTNTRAARAWPPTWFAP